MDQNDQVDGAQLPLSTTPHHLSLNCDADQLRTDIDDKDDDDPA